jgi:hypothetical protein
MAIVWLETVAVGGAALLHPVHNQVDNIVVAVVLHLFKIYFFIFK